MKTSNQPWVKIYLCNGMSIGTRCGYGEGPTREAAIEHALRLARQRDPSAYFDGREVVFCQSVCL